MKHQGFDFRRHLYLEEDTFNVKKREIIFFLLFIKFSIRSAVLLTVYIVLSFYFSLRGKNIRTSKFLTTSPQPYAEKKKSRCFCFKKIVATNWEFFFFFFFRKNYRLIYTKTTWEVNMHSRNKFGWNSIVKQIAKRRLNSTRCCCLSILLPLS